MRRAPFFQLCCLFRTRGLLRDSVNTVIEEQVAMFLMIVGHNQRFRVLPTIFRRSLETISRYFHEVLYAVGELRSEMIVGFSTATPAKILNITKWYPVFKDCVGSTDGTHVIARVPARQKAAFVGRKHTTTQNVLAVVDFDLRFTYILAGWEGSAHDARILTNALERPDGLKVPTGKFVLADAGYSVRPGFLPPYRATRYHLREFGASSPQNPRELFNSSSESNLWPGHHLREEGVGALARYQEFKRIKFVGEGNYKEKGEPSDGVLVAKQLAFKDFILVVLVTVVVIQAIFLFNA